ncbi:hypothetical protein D9M69_513840 [compost metagenome]
MLAPSRHCTVGSTRRASRWRHSPSLLKIQRCFSRMADSMSASVTQRGAVIDRPRSSMVKPMVRRAERLSV